MLHRIIISGGGTGGHIFPAVAIANEIKRRYPSCDILFVGASGRMEMEKVPAAGFKIIGLPITGIQRKLTLSNLLVPFRLLRSIRMAKKIISDFKPQVVIGVGGYASAAVLYVASGNKIPSLIQEQNSFAGLTNKWLGKKVARICVAYPDMEKFFPAGKIVLTGNPVRAELHAANSLSKKDARTKLGFDPGKPLVLVTGGSLGARTINLSMGNIARDLDEKGIQVLWQTGRFYQADTEHLRHVKASAFIEDMATAYAAADIVVSRAGAISVSEISLLGKAAILIPSPNVAEDHQTKNAMSLVNRHAAVLLKDKDAASQLMDHIENLIKDTGLQSVLSKHILEFAKPDALKHIVNEIEKLAN